MPPADRSTTRAGGDRSGRSDDGRAPSDAFQVLGNETRTAVLRSLATDQPAAFSDLYADSAEDTSAGFAYHLRQLTGRFVRRREDERYELTSAGRRVVRALRAGSYTDSVERDAVDLHGDCPFCGEPALVATVDDDVTRAACESCEAGLLGLSFPPSGYSTRDAGDVSAALSAYHRHRIDAFADGVCPDCGGPVSASLEPAGDGPAESGGEGPTGAGDRAPAPHDDGGRERVPVQTSFECDACGAGLRCPVSLTVLGHPATVAFYHDHDRDVRERPLWNVGTEWRERILSRDPWCVRVRSRLDEECLLLYVGGDGTVVEHRRVGPDDDPGLGAEGEPAPDEGRSGDHEAGDEPAETASGGNGAAV